MWGIVPAAGSGSRATYGGARIAYAVQGRPAGLCDALFQALPLIGNEESVVVGLPDTVWFPVDGLRRLGNGNVELLLFEVDRPELFDAVIADESGRVTDIEVLDVLDAVAVHGFPLDWNHWQIDDWPDLLAAIRAVTALPVWVTEVGVSTFGAEEVQEFGLRRAAELLGGKAARIHWYGLCDLPRAWPATARHREAEGSSYFRHFYMGLLREDGTPKRALRHFADYTPELGICQWFHFEDPRLDDAVQWLQKLGVKRVRTGLSWADSERPEAERWLDRLVRALEPFEATATFCFTPGARGERDDHTSPPRDVHEFADFCGRMAKRYAR